MLFDQRRSPPLEFLHSRMFGLKPKLLSAFVHAAIRKVARILGASDTPRACPFSLLPAERLQWNRTQKAKPSLDCAQPAAAFTEPACWRRPPADESPLSISQADREETGGPAAGCGGGKRQQAAAVQGATHPFPLAPYNGAPIPSGKRAPPDAVDIAVPFLPFLPGPGTGGGGGKSNHELAGSIAGPIAIAIAGVRLPS